jgi:hypothetical protein
LTLYFLVWHEKIESFEKPTDAKSLLTMIQAADSAKCETMTSTPNCIQILTRVTQQRESQWPPRLRYDRILLKLVTLICYN